MEKETIILDFRVDGKEAIVSIENLTKANKELREERKRLDLQSEEGQARARELNSQIDKNTEIIKTNSSALEKQRLNVGNYKNSIVDASKEINLFGVSVGGATSKIASFATPATMAAGILSGLAAAYARSTTGAKDLEFASTQLSVATGMLSEKFAQLFSSAEDGEGFFSTILNGLLFKISPELAIQSRMVALAQEKIQDLNREEIALRSVINDRLEENQEKLTRIQSEQSSIAEKARLTKEIQDNLRLNAEDQLKLKKEELVQLQLILALDKENETKQEAVLQKKREISQIEAATTKAVERIQKLQDNIVEGQVKRVEQEDIIKQKLQDQADILQAQADIKKQSDEEALLRNVDLYKTTDLEKYLNDESALYDKHYQELLDKQKAKEKQEVVLTQLTQFQKLGIISNAVGTLAGVIGKQSQEGKALATVQALVDTYAGANAQLKLPYPYNILAVGTTILAGLANVAKIQGFKQGGYTGDMDTNQVAGVTHGKEFVMPASVVSQFGKDHFQSYMDGSIIANSMGSMGGGQGQAIKVDLVYKEFSDFKNRVEYKEQMATA